MLTRVSVRLTSDTDQFRLNSINAALFFQLSDASIGWIFPVVDESSWERVEAFKWVTSPRDEKDVVRVLVLLCNDCINSDAWCLVVFLALCCDFNFSLFNHCSLCESKSLINEL